MEVIGRGLIGSSILESKWRGPNDLVVIAAGVSNSRETRAAEFQREIDLIKAIISNQTYNRVVLVSSCSISQYGITPYTEHKRRVEDIVIRSGLLHHIYRLPQVVGPANNLTLVSYFVKSIIGKMRIELNTLANRYLIDIDDLIRIIDLVYAKYGSQNLVLDIAPVRAINSVDIFLEIMRIMRLDKLDITLVSRPDSYFVNPAQLIKILGHDDVLFQDDYPCRVLRKWVPAITSMLH